MYSTTLVYSTAAEYSTTLVYSEAVVQYIPTALRRILSQLWYNLTALVCSPAEVYSTALVYSHDSGLLSLLWYEYIPCWYILTALVRISVGEWVLLPGGTSMK